MNGEFKNALERQQQLMRYRAMDRDKGIQKAWKAYQKATRKLPAKSRASKYQFYDTIIKTEGYKGGQGTRWSQRHEEF